jgi:thiosulfate/3-mercaptopyruvate sulfurtransferase
MHNDSSSVSTIVSCKWLNENQHLGHLIILDASEKTDTTSEGCIPKSRYANIKENLSDLEAEFPNTIPSQEQFQQEARKLGINNNSLIVVYDDKGMYWSPRVWWLFRTFGFGNVAVLDGGLPEWKRLGYQTISSLADSKWEVGDVSAVYQSNNMCYFDAISEASNNDNIQILDARSEERFKCLVPEPRVGLRSGILPNSQNLPYSILFDGHCLKPKEELKIIFNTFKIEDKSLIFSCGSGITACILALAAEISDYKKLTVYDGSWTEYGTLIT